MGWKEKRNDKRAQFCYGWKEKVNEFYLFNFLMESKNECFIQSFEWKQKKINEIIYSISGYIDKKNKE